MSDPATGLEPLNEALPPEDVPGPTATAAPTLAPAAEPINGWIELFLMLWRRQDVLEAGLRAAESRAQSAEACLASHAQGIDQMIELLDQHARLINEHSAAIVRLQGVGHCGLNGEEPPATAATVH